MTPTSDREKAWVEAARRVRENAVCGRSGFAVGAALEAADGTIFTGCNVENSTYGLTAPNAWPCGKPCPKACGVSPGSRW